MRDITTITQEEIKQFLDATVGGEYRISRIEVNAERKEVIVGVVTKWGGNGTGDPLSDIEDEFIFGQYELDTDKFPGDFEGQYFQFRTAKGFAENQFIDTNLIAAAPVMYEALKMALEIGDQCSRGFLAEFQDKAKATLAKAEGRDIE